MSGLRNLRTRYQALVHPRDDGLPNRTVLLVPLVGVLTLLLLLVGFGITGSSTGVLNNYLESTPDEELLVNEPQMIRSDEWFVQTSWTISQVEQGLPAVNETFPGGMDATVQHDLPSRDWSVAFRPHLWGFFVLPLDNAMALKWWLPGLALVAAVYAFAVTLLPRNPGASLFIAGGLFYAPFFQWWYLSITFWPAVWTFLVMTAAVWLLRSRSRGTVIIWPLLCGYVTVTMGMGIYVPFILPAVYIVLAFVVGLVLTKSSSTVLVTFRARLRAMVPLLLAGGAAGVVLVVWLLTRWSTIELFMGTVYPGQRLWPVGGVGPMEARALLGAPFSSELDSTNGAPFGSNQSEASSVFLVGLFLLGVVAWLVVDRFRKTREIDWLLVSLFAVAGLFGAYMWIPGWDSLAHLLLLDRTTSGRLRLGLGTLSVVMMIVVAARLRAPDVGVTAPRIPWWVSAVTVVLAIGVNLKVVHSLAIEHALILDSPGHWRLIMTLYVLVIFLSSRGWIALAGLGFFTLSYLGSSWVNPVYEGVYDINDTPLGEEVRGLADERPGTWVGVGETFLPTIVLVQTGVPAYNGFQSSPSEVMWEQIDPDGTHEEQWNRLANVSWQAGTGDPAPQNPYPDQIRMTFDSCGAFAQENVTWVLADAPVDQACLTEVDEIQQGNSTFWVYELAAR